MNFKIPSGIIENFIFSNFSEAKKTSSGEIHINDPISNDNKLRLYINPEKSMFFNQREQIGGNFSGFVAEYLGISHTEVASLLIREYSSKEDLKGLKIKEIVEVKKELDLPEGLVFFENKPDGLFRNKAAKYLRQRGIPLDGLGYVYKTHSEFHKRIFIPFYENGRIVYFLARAFDGSKLRYKNPKNVSASNVVFNIDKIEDEVFIFEGVFDAMSLKSQVATCMLSSNLKREQAIKILDRMPERIIFVLDNDQKPETRKIIEKNLHKNINLLMKLKSFSLNLKIYTFRPPEEYKDFNDYYVATGTDFINLDDCELVDDVNKNKLSGMLDTWGRK